MYTVFLSLSSGLIGAILALVGNYLVSKRTAEMQMKTTVLTNFMTARLEAYKDFITALNIWSDKRDIPSCGNVYRAANSVALVASDETIAALADVQNTVRAFETTGVEPKQPEFGHQLLLLQIAMHEDLLAYDAPTVRLKKAKH